MTNNNSETFEDVVEMIEASNSNDENQIATSSGRTFLVVGLESWRSSSGRSLESSYACDSERAVLSWNAERCR